MELDPTSYNTQKVTKWTTDLNGVNRTIKLLEKNTGANFCDLGLGNSFLHLTPEA